MFEVVRYAHPEIFVTKRQTGKTYRFHVRDDGTMKRASIKATHVEPPWRICSGGAVASQLPHYIDRTLETRSCPLGPHCHNNWPSRPALNIVHGFSVIRRQIGPPRSLIARVTISAFLRRLASQPLRLPHQSPSACSPAWRSEKTEGSAWKGSC